MKKFIKLCTLVLAFILFVQTANATSAVFRDLPLEAAKAKAKGEGRLLLIDFTASWCGPCHKMEQTTWSDATVQKWIADNAIAIQLDVDKEKSTAEAFKIQAMPSVIVFSQKDFSKEFDRQVGYQTAPELLEWLSAVKNGETSFDRLKHAVEKFAGKGGKDEVKARHGLGHALLEQGDYTGAIDQYVWLWQKLPTEMPDAMPARSSYLAGEISQLTNSSAAAKKKFAEIRDEALANKNYLDFAILNDVLDQSDKTLEWFDSAKQLPQDKDSRQVTRRLERLMISKGRWADVLKLYPDYMAELKKREELAKTAKAAMPDFDPFPKDSAILYACLLAAHRDADAKKLATECLKIRDSAAMKKQLVITALVANQARKTQAVWIADDKELSAKLQEMLKAPKK